MEINSYVAATKLAIESWKLDISSLRKATEYYSEDFAQLVYYDESRCALIVNITPVSATKVKVITIDAISNQLKTDILTFEGKLKLNFPIEGLEDDQQQLIISKLSQNHSTIAPTHPPEPREDAPEKGNRNAPQNVELQPLQYNSLNITPTEGGSNARRPPDMPDFEDEYQMLRGKNTLPSTQSFPSIGEDDLYPAGVGKYPQLKPFIDPVGRISDGGMNPSLGHPLFGGPHRPNMPGVPPGARYDDPNGDITDPMVPTNFQQKRGGSTGPPGFGQGHGGFGGFGF